MCLVRVVPKVWIMLFFQEEIGKSISNVGKRDCLIYRLKIK